MKKEEQPYTNIKLNVTTPPPYGGGGQGGEAGELFSSQLSSWETARSNYDALSRVKVKEMEINGCLYKVQFNPARIVSSAAKVDTKSIRERKCFLCPAHLPPVQEGIPFGGHYQILVNPFPIFPRHLTIPELEHVEQRILPRFGDMLDLADTLPDYVVFYNGPKCGASAPDHAHFQAGNKGFLPIEKEWKEKRAERIITQEGATLWALDDHPRATLLIEGEKKEATREVFDRIYYGLSPNPSPVGRGDKMASRQQEEPMMNVLCWKEAEKWIACIFPRAKHRPSCYTAEGDTNLLISPASVDMGGVFITPLEKDFDKITASDIADILGEVCLNRTEFRKLIERIKREPLPPTPSPVGRGRKTSCYETADGYNYSILKEKQKELKQNPTEAERIVWEGIRNKRLGCKFRRQHIIDSYIVDFVCMEAKVVIEIDGGYHSTPEQQAKDEERSRHLESLGYRILRFTNEEVITQPEEVMKTIAQHTPPYGGGAGGEAPQIHVGILFEPQIEFILPTPYRVHGEKVSGKQVVTYDEGRILWQGRHYDELLFEPIDETTDAFELIDVTIGINFHWQRKEDQRFLGALKIIVEDGKLTGVNVINVEDYLTSVISSEMSATASLELLKAHAVISRSWLLANKRPAGLSPLTPSPVGRGSKDTPIYNNNINNTDNSKVTPTPPPYGGGGKGGEAGEEQAGKPEAHSLIRWYERDAHTRFDVCADDHCQRYQGITRASTEIVKQAIEATRGQVLMSGGKICDARFSKCCGGAFEEFQYCWDDTPYSYLARQRDSKTHTDLPDLRREDEAERWIRTSPEAFCNTTDKRVLSQVLNNYDQETTDFYRWKVEYTQDELSGLIKLRSGIDYGQIIDLVPVARGTSGRLWKLKIVGTKRTMTIGKELEIRRTLSPSHLYSSAFVVDKEDITDGVPGRFILTGAGWGHGVGLCQIGAAVMGEQGYKYDEILLHYYHGEDTAIDHSGLSPLTPSPVGRGSEDTLTKIVTLY